MLRYIFLALAIIVSFPQRCFALEASAKSACLISADSGQVIFAKNPHERLPMASTTKMMTALLAAESGRWEEQVYISRNACMQEGTRVYLEEGDSAALGDLVRAMLMNSGNDAAVAIAEHLGGSTEAFAAEMTARAHELGAKDTGFENPSGLDGENHLSTAYDLAIIGSAVVKNPLLAEIISTKNSTLVSASGNITYLKNHNKLLWSYNGLDGIKTGYTKKAGRCLVTSANRGGVRLVAVTLCDADDWKDHKNMLDYGFEVCKNEPVLTQGEVLTRVRVGGEPVNLVCASGAKAVSICGRVRDYEVVLHKLSDIEPPIDEREKLGYAGIVQNGREIGRVDLVAQTGVSLPEVSYWRLFFDKIAEFAGFCAKRY